MKKKVSWLLMMMLRICNDCGEFKVCNVPAVDGGVHIEENKCKIKES